MSCEKHVSHNGVQFRIEVAPRFLTRLREAEKFTLASREAEEAWFQNTGDYSYSQFLPKSMGPELLHIRKREENETLLGAEFYIAQYIKHLLHNLDNEPVVCVDVGGMAGASWKRLASAFHAAVQSDKLVMVVTNISSTSIAGKKEVSHDESDELVQFIDMDMFTYNKTQFTYKGRKKPLFGSVDVLHESLSVNTHSKVPEWDVPNVAELVSERGVYLVEDPDFTPSPFINRMNAKEYGEELEDRHKGLRLAHKHLTTNADFTYQTSVLGRSGNYFPLRYRKYTRPLFGNILIDGL